MQRIILPLFFLLLLGVKVHAQIPTNQDCLGAIPVCQKVFVQPNAFSGTGNYPNEINPSLSCLNSGEKNDVWYVFTVQSTGNLSFTIFTVSPGDDYDWALYNLTNAQCSDIYNNPALEVSCNFSGIPGTTGANMMIGPQYEPVVPVLIGQTYVLNISNFTSNQNGYTLDFTASTATIYDSIPPVMQSFNAIQCTDDSLEVTFSENIQCGSVQVTDFTFVDPVGNPIILTSINSPNCVSGADYSKTYVLKFAPALTLSGNYTLSLVDTVLDVCSNVGIFPADIVVNVAGSSLVMASSDVLCPLGNSGTGSVTSVNGGTGPFTYLWSNGQTTATTTGLGVGTFTVTVTPSAGCPTGASVVIAAPIAFNVVPNITSAVCGQANGSCTVTVTGGTTGYSYTWSSGSPNSSTANGLAAGNYTVTVTDANLCTTTLAFVVPTVAGVSASILSSANVSCFGGNDGTATAGTANGSGNYSYLWSNSITTNPASVLTAGTFTCTVTDINTGCTATTTVVITQPATAVSVVVNSTPTSCGQSNGTATAVGSNGIGPHTYLWSNAATTGVVNNLAQSTYTVTVSDANGCTITATVAVNTSNAPVANVVASADVKCNGGSDGSASTGCTGCNGVATYVWSNGATGSSITNFQVGTYTVTITDATGCTATVSVTINEPTAVAISAFTNDTICISQNALISPVINGGTPSYSYLWNTGATTLTINVSPVGNTTYTITATDANNCTVSQTAIIVVNPALVVSVSNDTTICKGSQITVSAFGSGGDNNFSYSWNGGLAIGSSILLSPTNDTSLTVVLTDGCGSPFANATVNIYVTELTADIINVLDAKCFGGNDGSATINLLSGGTAPFSYSWSNGNGSATANNLVAGTYTATISDNYGCSVSASVTISEPTQLVANIGTNPTICIGENTNLSINGTGGTPGYLYNWSIGSTTAIVNVAPVVSTSYYVTVTDVNNCTVSANYLVSVNPPLSITYITPNNVICFGDTISISISVTGGDNNYSYSWSNGSSSSTFQSSPTDTIMYYVTVSDGCTTPLIFDSVFVAVIEAPIVDFIYSPDHGCQPLIVTFTDSSQTVSGSSYGWNFGDGNSSTAQNPVYQYNTYGLFDVTLVVTTPQGCSSEIIKPAIIDVYPQPTAAFTYTPNNPTLYNPTIEFTDKSSGNVNTWTWNFGDSSASVTIQNPIHTYNDTGTYIVTLAVVNAYGCTDTLRYILIVKDLYSFYIPNSFTPNGDLKNDFFEVSGLNYTTFSASIFNRWGQLIRSASKNPVWDGKDEGGVDVQSGVYYYFIKAFEPTGKKHEYRGSVTLIK